MNSTKQIRNNYAQTKYRQASKSKNKKTQHVAHTVDLELVKTIQKKTKGRANLPKLKQTFNHPKNFRMVSQDTNLRDHRKIAKELMQSQNQRKKTVKLNKSLSLRTKRQVKVIQEDTSLPIAFKKSARKFYKKFKDIDGRTLWDCRKDEKQLKF